MNDLPTFSKADADRVLRRVAEIEGQDEGKSLTAAELRSIALEAGFGTPAVERAIAEAQQATRARVQHYPVQRTGLIIVRISTIRVLPVQLSAEQLMQGIRLSQPYRDGPAQVRLESDRVVWRDRKGIVTTVGSGGGETEIKVSVVKPLLRRGRWMGWVRSAADRLEAMLLLLDSRHPLDADALDPGLLPGGGG